MMPPTADDTAADGVSIRPYTAAYWTAMCRIHDAARPQELAAGGAVRVPIRLPDRDQLPPEPPALGTRICD